MNRSKARTGFIAALTVASIIAAGAPGVTASGTEDSSLSMTIRELGGLDALVRAAVAGKELPKNVRVSRFGDGWTKIAIPLKEDLVRPKEARDLENLAITIDLFEPDLFAERISYDLAPLTFFDYFWGWVTINRSNQDITAQSSIQRKGVGANFKVSENILYDANSLVLLVVERPVGGDAGIQTITVKVAGAKKLVSKTCPDCV